MNRAFSKIWIIVILVILIAGGILAWQYFDIPKEEKNQVGIIEGSLGYPSDFIPSDMKICAESITTGREYCTEDHIKDGKYTYGEGYKIEVPIGSYYVYATVQQMKDYKAYYSEFVTCGFKVDCPSHEPIVVAIDIGQVITDIDPQDWYRPPEEVIKDETADW